MIYEPESNKSYSNICIVCGLEFIGYKLQRICDECKTPYSHVTVPTVPLPTLSPQAAQEPVHG